MSAFIVEHEVFENQRWNSRTKSWGSDCPAHLGPSDPPRFTNRLHGHAANQLELAAWPCPPGWEWEEHSNWRIDKAYDGDVDKDLEGWRYGAAFPELRETLLWQTLPAGVDSMQEASDVSMRRALPVRWRRWVRRRRRVNERVTRTLTIRGTPLPEGWRADAVPEAAVQCEGWLLRFLSVGESGVWVPHWCVLLAKEGEAVLVYCNSFESLRVVEALTSPPTPLLTNPRPAVPRALALRMNETQLERCFGLGSARAAEGVLHCPLSEAEGGRWAAAFERAAALVARAATEPTAFVRLPPSPESLDGEATKPAQLCVSVIGATNLAATESDGTTDPYVTVSFRGTTGPRRAKRKTAVIQGTCAPRWDAEVFTFDDAVSVHAHVHAHVHVHDS